MNIIHTNISATVARTYTCTSKYVQRVRQSMIQNDHTEVCPLNFNGIY